MSEIHERLLKAIQESGLSYGELYKITGIGKSVLQRYATGKTPKIPLPRLEQLAQALNVSAAWLMGWTDEPTDYGVSPEKAEAEDRRDPCKTRLLTAYGRLNGRGREMVADYAEMLADSAKYGVPAPAHPVDLSMFVGTRAAATETTETAWKNAQEGDDDQT